MPQTIMMIRHGEALHNKDPQFKQSRDPGLTEDGKKQCRELRDHLKEKLENTKVDLIIVSPMQRTLETAMIALDWLIEKNKVPVEASALWQEIYSKPCDTGRPVAIFKDDFPLVDFTKLEREGIWPDKTSGRAHLYHPSKEGVLYRAETATKNLVGRPARYIIVVSHSGFMRKALFGRWFGFADYRIFNLPGEDGPWGDWLKWEEQPGSETGGMGRSKAEKVVVGTDLYIP
ncbi:phosphoglycerate mutase-like protein 1 [Podospora fimiseda]|uniref:Phosphoglycerate mutase-like protein 1 n=1 Tax=Podospora fimiseda TaxID=252190 RepID=A0AAN6YRI6_9PEZI|nr:phosphoglycerate mutase-like protein 1 [Podospora fimiseda]